MDGTGEQGEGFGRRREPNTISWGRRAAAGAAVNPLRVAPWEFSRSQRRFHLIPPSLSHPSCRLSRSKQGMCCWMLSSGCAAALLSLRHTHTGTPQPPLGMAPAAKIPPAQQVLLSPGVFPSDSHSKDLQGEDLELIKCPGSALPVPPNTRLATQKEEDREEISPNFLQNNNSEQFLQQQKHPGISQSLTMARVGRTLNLI